MVGYLKPPHSSLQLLDGVCDQSSGIIAVRIIASDGVQLLPFQTPDHMTELPD